MFWPGLGLCSTGLGIGRLPAMFDKVWSSLAHTPLKPAEFAKHLADVGQTSAAFGPSVANFGTKSTRFGRSMFEVRGLCGLHNISLVRRRHGHRAEELAEARGQRGGAGAPGQDAVRQRRGPQWHDGPLELQALQASEAGLAHLAELVRQGAQGLERQVVHLVEAHPATWRSWIPGRNSTLFAPRRFRMHNPCRTTRLVMPTPAETSVMAERLKYPKPTEHLLATRPEQVSERCRNVDRRAENWHKFDLGQIWVDVGKI